MAMFPHVHVVTHVTCLRPHAQSVFTSFDFDESGEVDYIEFGAMWRCLNGNPTNVEIQVRDSEGDVEAVATLVPAAC